MVIIEGPDGAGKTRLLRALLSITRLRQGPRASDSIEGPVPNVWDWAVMDIASWPTFTNRLGMAIYDRHPMISEPIYGPIIRNNLDRNFTDPANWKVWEMFRQQALIVLCIPPFGEVQKNIMNEKGPGQMTGVQQYRKELYDAYVGWGLDHLGEDYAGVLYDYTDETGNYGLNATVAGITQFLQRSA